MISKFGKDFYTPIHIIQIGALTTLADGVVNPHDGCLTFLGRILAELPIDIRLGKLILLGYVFNALEQTVIIGKAYWYIIKLLIL